MVEASEEGEEEEKGEKETVKEGLRKLRLSLGLFQLALAHYPMVTTVTLENELLRLRRTLDQLIKDP